MEPPFGWGTKKAIGELAKELDLPNEEWMQDWPYEVANAFEQIIEERLPRFHRIVRTLYDRYGLPLSNYIRTPIAADIVYISMKPLEYLFFIVLYLFDLAPEKRITRQYLPQQIK